jgi:hypothetical protein
VYMLNDFFELVTVVNESLELKKNGVAHDYRHDICVAKKDIRLSSLAHI